MDDALLEDDSQFKDEEVDDELDEAALLGLSDDEILDASSNDDQTLDFLKEQSTTDGDHSVVNTGMYHSNEDDVLEVNIDADLEDDAENSYITEVPRKPVPQEHRYKENLISITLIPSGNGSHTENSEVEVSHAEYPEGESVKNDSVLLDDEESEDEKFDDDHRDRFKSERSNIITLTPAKKRTDIPDSLDSVLISEERAKAQAFLENERKRKKAYVKTRNFVKEKPGTTQIQHSSRFHAPSGSPHKILINPHFGKPAPPSSVPIRTSDLPPQRSSFSSSITSTPNYNFQQQQNYSNPETNNPLFSSSGMFSSSVDGTSYSSTNQPVTPYSHGSVANLQRPSADPNFHLFNNPAAHFSQPATDLHQPHAGNQAAPYLWCHPPPNVGSTPLPPHVTSNYVAPAYSAPPPTYAPPAFSSASYQGPFEPNIQPQIAKSDQFITNPSWVPPINKTTPPPVVKQNVIPHPSTLNEISQIGQNVKVYEHHLQHKPFDRIKRMSQMHVRKLVKRSASFASRSEPAKQLRMDDGHRVANFVPRKPNSNIKQIPLVENLPSEHKKTNSDTRAPAEEEDEKTRELRMKIEEQKKLREQILKRKEERRRQMALQRLQELRARQGASNQTKPLIITRVGLLQTAGKQVADDKKIPLVKKATQAGGMNHLTFKKETGIHQRIGIRKISLSDVAQNNTSIILDNTNRDIANKQINLEPNRIQTAAQRTLIVHGTVVHSPINRKSQAETKSAAVLKKGFVNPYHFSGGKRHPVGTSNNMSPLNNRPFIPDRRQLRMPFIAKNVHFQRMPSVRGPAVQMNPMGQPDWMCDPVSAPGNYPFPQFERNKFGGSTQIRNAIPFVPPQPNIRHGIPLSFPAPHPPFLEPERPSMNIYSQRRFDSPFVNCRPRALFLPPFRPQPPRSFTPFNLQPQNISRPTNMPLNRHRYPPSSNFHARQQQSMSPSVSKNSKVHASSKKGTSATEKNGNGKGKKVDASAVEQAASMQKDIQPKTRTVVVNNLSSSTTENQLRNLGTTIGPIESIELQKDHRKAIILFKDENHALKFQMKYQRYCSIILKFDKVFRDIMHKPFLSFLVCVYI